MIVPSVGIPTIKGEMTMNSCSEYLAHLDSRKRITLRRPKHEFYQVRMYDNGCILLEPRVMTPPETLSERSLKAMDEAVRNLDSGLVSAPIDLSAFQP